MTDYQNRFELADDAGYNHHRPSQTRSHAPKIAELDANTKEERQPSPDDVWIAVTGVTGAGKSTFISLFVDQKVDIGHGLFSATKKVNIFRCDTLMRGRSVWFVDTPGFDDTQRSETEILEEIATYFVKLYTKGIRFSGLLYLQRITDPRMSGTAVKNLELFKLVCGSDAYPIVRLITTRWNECKAGTSEYDASVDREAQLSESPKFFQPLLQGGAQLLRLENNTADSAGDIVNTILINERRTALGIQREMLNEQKTLGQTSAGCYLNSEYAALSQRYEQELKDLKESLEEAIRDRDEESRELLRIEMEQSQARQYQLYRDQQNMTATFQELDVRKEQELKRQSIEVSGCPETYGPQANDQHQEDSDAKVTAHSGDHAPEAKESRRHRFKEHMSAEWHSIVGKHRRHSRRTALQEVQLWLWGMAGALLR